MANGRTHERINITALAVVGGTHLYFLWQGAVALPAGAYLGFVGSYLLGTFLITPDLDLAERRVRPKHHWGRWGWLWFLYGKNHKHRGYSHTWFLGPSIRLLYLLMVMLLLLLPLAWLASQLEIRFNLPDYLRRHSLPFLSSALGGYYLSQWLHLLADRITPIHGVKVRKRRAKQRALKRRGYRYRSPVSKRKAK